MARTTTLTWAQYADLWDRWATDFLSSPRSFVIGGRPVAAFNNLSDFVARYGRITFSVMLSYGARRVERLLGVPPYLLGVIGQASQYNVRLANALPVDGITGYGLLPNWLGAPVQQYRELIAQRTAEWEQMQRRLTKPFYPVVCAGWDATMRGDGRRSIRASDGYPYSPVVVGVSVALFGRFLDAAIDFNARWSPRENLVFLHAWNEWTEASVLEPSDRFGTTLLEEVRARTAPMSTCVLNDVGGPVVSAT